MKWIGKHPVFSDLLIGGVLLTPPDNQYSYELTLPNDDGTSGQVLTTDGNGVLTWTTNGSGTGTVTSITPAADSGTGTAITTSGDIAVRGGSNATTSVTGTTITVNATNTTYTAGDGLDLSGTTFSTDLKSNGGLVIESTELAVDLGASSITGVLADGDVAQDLTIVAGSINNTPIGATTANTIAGTTIDASTDFTVGSTVITDDQIQFTPSTSDTVTIAAAANGALNITCSDASGAKHANLLVTRDGTAEIAGTTLTLDASQNIELEVGAVTNYVNTTGVLRSGNQGMIQYVGSEYYIPICSSDFLGQADSRGGPTWGMGTATEYKTNRSSDWAVCERIVPLGFKATGCQVWGDGTTNTFTGYEGAINANTATAQGSATAVGGSASDFTTDGGADIVGDGVKTCAVYVILGNTSDLIYGGKIILEKV